MERGALDAARESGITICGWCPKDGCAEDCPVPPGVLESYPELRETPMANQKQKAEWNIRDSHATVIIRPQNCVSAGTDYAEKMCKEYNRPRFVARGMAEIPELKAWLNLWGDGLTVNITGPKASEAGVGYLLSKRMVRELLG